MIEAGGQVLSVDGDRALVRSERPSACGSCGASGGCGTSLLAEWFPQRHLEFVLPNTIDASPGDRVVIGLDESYLQKGSLLLYALPLVGLLAGAILGDEVGRNFFAAPELGSISFGLLGVIAAFAAVGRFSRRLSGRGDGGVKLLRVAHRTVTMTAEALQDTLPGKR